MAALRRLGTAVILMAVLNTLPGHPVLAGVGDPAPALCPWAGIYPTVVTPWCAKGGVDVAALERQLKYELQGGVRGLLVLGTIGEGQYATEPERDEVIATVVRVACQAPVIVGIHTCNVEWAKYEMLKARNLGAAAVLVKYLGNPHASADEVFGFYATLSRMRVLPVFYYHYPRQTGLHLPPRAVADILGLPGVVGIKESTLNLRETEAHIRLTCGLGKACFTSTALNLTQFLAMGGQGAMCPEAVLAPAAVVQCYNAYVHGHQDEARSVQQALFVVEPVVGSFPLPPAVAGPLEMAAADHEMRLPLGPNHPEARIKAALNCLGVATPTLVKCPLPQLNWRDRRRVKTAVSRLQDIDWCEVALKVPPVPLHTCPESNDGGMLLKTGGIQLGPGTQENLVGWQGDGKGGL
jgi:4-hydroxy-tetrahydrodipicolinate synthase